MSHRQLRGYSREIAREDAADRGAPAREFALAAAGRHRRSHEGFYDR